MKKQLYFLQEKLRLSDPWNYKVPVLISITYLVMLIGNIPFYDSLKYFCLSLLTIAGIAGYAYLLNDWADIQKDTASGKPNSMVGLAVSTRVLLLIAFFVLAIMPWFFFPYNRETIFLLVLELLLFLVYATPPFRLKEKPIAGVVTDALYAHVLPCLLAALTFFGIAEVSNNNKIHQLALLNAPFLILLTAWQFSLGFRNILLHQLEDLDNDISSGTQTFATRYGKIVADKWLLYFALPAELIFLFAFVAALSQFTIIFAMAYAVFIAYLFLFKEKLSLTIRSFCYNFLDDFYMDWFPLAALIALILVDWRFIALFLIHVFLFRNILRALHKQHIAK